MTEKCCNPSAPVEKCVVCGADVYTCEREDSTDEGDYTCPAHPDGVLMLGGDWVCSTRCWGDYHRRLGHIR